jgi:hypothetical protein
MEVPVCPDPAHGGGRVVRAGWYGRPPHRRQRWRCHPRNGDRPHRFCEVLPRQATSERHCIECSTRLERWEGQAGAREYWFSAREVGQALALVAGGESYRQAARAARIAAGRTRPAVTGGRGRPRDPDLDGQLVANWVDVLGPVVCAGELPTVWPRRLALDSIEFRIDRGPRAGESFHVFAAVGHDEPARPRVWRMAAFPRRTQADWEEFLSPLAGTPRLVVTDFDRAVRNALASVFPRDEDPRPELRVCELHVRRRLENALAPLAGHPEHRVMAVARKALYHSDNWALFERHARHTHDLASPPLPGLARWLDYYGETVAAQLETRSSLGPNSIGAVEAALRQVERAFLGRSQSFGNRPRLDQLLGLMTLHANGHADPRRWADRLRARLHPHRGVPPRQRPHDDRRGQPSLFN